ncbi:PREDICTED: protein IQ-DOMAIN 1-like [Nelumbo nucifera]|uniref:Protein IQ-DOMAIN 1-like n=1 Tax=Nelumbo nucifera TaxID=4432 RepID=A0A1U7ZB14_NELNU|nr:PREDICTED: protein IQ-DOMAIN 1-like [Nelumbo nucifera]XP_010244963.1 PREDICTED: protein IQ-DOMAIN 1-like [Nelumbo nucifera]XP_010244964.1 PREDICTED: protein IQ-DOMAIN 1-like [Nelumbo nucifera]
MGKKGNWFVAVKKAFSPESKEKKDQKSSKSKKKWFGKEKHPDPSTSSFETASAVPPLPQNSPPPPPPPPPPEEVQLTEAENEQSKHAYSVAIATAVAAEAAVAAAQAAAEVVRLTSVTRFSGKSKEEIAAIKIQTAFRGYLARRALRALRGLVRLKSLIHGNSVKRQATTTLRCMQTLARVQSQIRSRRIRMMEENQALQRQLQQKREKELASLRASMGEDWDDSLQSKEQIEASLLSKQEAAMRRERALAYAFSHQQMWKNSRSVNPTFMDPNNPHWGWSWLERWMAARPWESRSMTEKELNNDQASVISASRSVGGEISKAYARRELNAEKPSPTAQKPSRSATRQSPSTPSKATSSSVAGKLNVASPGGSLWGQDDDSRSMFSMQSEKHRRHSIAGSSVRDDESLASSPSVPSYMAPTESAKAKTRLQSPLGLEKNGTGTPEKGSAGSVKKRLSYPASPAALRRHSGPPKVDTSSIKDIGIPAEHSVSNGGSR